MFDVESAAPDAQAIVLLCSSLAAPRNSSARPLGPRSWAKLERLIADAGMPGPAGLMGMSADEVARRLDVPPVEADRYVELLTRAGQLAFELDRLHSRGMWVATVVDSAYPSRLRVRLGADAPPVLFGAGPSALLDGGGIAIVGSRDADASAVAFTEALAAAAAAGGTTVVSGGARGVDQVAMSAAFARGGTVIGVLPEGVERRIREVDTRTAVADGRAVVVSPYHPAAGFSAGAAMARNKLIYALSDVAVVVSSALGSGGTWEGAVEALRSGWVPVLVRDDPSAPEGNRELVRQGGQVIARSTFDDSLTPAALLRLGEPPRRAADQRGDHRQQSIWED